MVEHHPVHNSEVYLLGLPQRPSVPPPSPPSPFTPSPADPGVAIQELCLDEADSDDDDAPPPTQLGAGESTPVVDGLGHETDDDGDNDDGGGVSRKLLAKQRLSTAIHVLDTEATAVRALVRLYETDRAAAAGFDAAVQAITRYQHRPPKAGSSSSSGSGGERGKVVLVGVGKSGHIARKLAATFNSLGVAATFLHPTEALHGDLGAVGPRDTVLFVTFSGRTPELLALLPHLDEQRLVVLTGAHRGGPADCEIIARRRRSPAAATTVLLPAPVHEPEAVSFGVAAPTTSTTVALALGDALAVAAAQELHRGVPGSGGVPAVFARNHPGGAIGASFQQYEQERKQKPNQNQKQKQNSLPPRPPSPPPQEARTRAVRDLAVPLRDIPTCRGTSTESGDATAADVLKAALDSPSGWVRTGGGGEEGEREEALAPPSRIRALVEMAHLGRGARSVPGLAAPRGRWVAVPADALVGDAADLVRASRAGDSDDDGGGGGEKEPVVLAAVGEDGDVVGVLEAARLLDVARAT